MSQKQAKRRRREERTKSQRQVPGPTGSATDEGENEIGDLEELLKSGDIDDYAHACWSLANRMEGPPRAGDVITNLGTCEEHGSHEYKFRLTLRSMMTIAQCVGVETCDQAIRLVAKRLPPEQLPCYQFGHREQFQDLFIYGIPLHECFYCGETPQTMGTSKSIGWPDGTPVKGVNGQEYTTCPNCNSEMLEVQGEKLGEWGWAITCLECEWRIKQAELLDISQYCALMEQTKKDLNGAIDLMETTSVDEEIRVRAVAVQARRILENVAFAALVSNKDAWDKCPEEMKNMWNPKEIFKDLEKVHPDFFPKPVKVRTPNKGKDKPMMIKTEGVLTREKLLQIYRELSPLAHSRNPMDDPIDYDHFKEKIPLWLEELANTLATHQVMLLHHPDHFYIVKMQGDKDGSVQCTPFTKDPTGTVKCAWPDCVSARSRLHCEFWGRPWSECTLPEKEPAQTQGKMVGFLIDEEVAEEQAQELLGQARRSSGSGTTG